MLFELSLIFLSFSLIFQTLYSDKEGLVKLKNAVKDMRKAGNGEEQELTISVYCVGVYFSYRKRNWKLSTASERYSHQTDSCDLWR